MFILNIIGTIVLFFIYLHLQIIYLSLSQQQKCMGMFYYYPKFQQEEVVATRPLSVVSKNVN
jgi:hypothetical protein